MNQTMKLTASVIAVYISVIVLLSTSLSAQESQSAATKKAEAEMQAHLGTVPIMMKVLPDHVRASAWEWFKATQSPDGAIPKKYSELMSLAVASQIPCDYCVYAHTTMAKMFGATDAEIHGAVAAAAETRHWSTVLNGTGISLDEFKEEWDDILEHLEDQSGSK